AHFSSTFLGALDLEFVPSRGREVEPWFGVFWVIRQRDDDLLRVSRVTARRVTVVRTATLIRTITVGIITSCVRVVTVVRTIDRVRRTAIISDIFGRWTGTSGVSGIRSGVVTALAAESTKARTARKNHCKYYHHREDTHIWCRFPFARSHEILPFAAFGDSVSIRCV